MADAPRILFVSLTNDVGSDRIVSELGCQGATLAVLGPRGCFASLSRFVSHRVALPAGPGAFAATLAIRSKLTATIGDWMPEQVVPLDELSALVLRTIAVDARTPPQAKAVLREAMGQVGGYAASCHRVALMEIAAQAGVRVPAFARAGSETPPPFPLLVKRDHSSGSGGVAIVHDGKELGAALRRAAFRQRAKRVMARAAGFAHEPGPILLQQFVPGSLAMRTVVAREGVVVDGISLQALRSHPEKRASTVLQPIQSPDMDEAARRLVAALGCSGFVSFDFILDPQGRAFVIEMNPRPIGSTHLGRLFGHDLGHAFLTGTPQACGEAMPLPAVRAVALFPKELERDPSGAGLAGGSDILHDVPWDEPDVLAAYLRHLGKAHPAEAAALNRRFGAAQGRPPAREPRTFSDTAPAGS